MIHKTMLKWVEYMKFQHLSRANTPEKKCDQNISIQSIYKEISRDMSSNNDYHYKKNATPRDRKSQNKKGPSKNPATTIIRDESQLDIHNDVYNDLMFGYKKQNESRASSRSYGSERKFTPFRKKDDIYE